MGSAGSLDNMIGSEEAMAKVKEARQAMRSAETDVLKSGSWEPRKSNYDGIVSWYHSEIGIISRETALQLAMGTPWEWR